MSGVAKNAAGHVEGFEIFIKYLPHTTTEESLTAFFAEAGPMVGAPRLLTTADGGCKGAGWVTFSTRGAMEQAITWNGCRLDGRSLQISAAKAAHMTAIAVPDEAMADSKYHHADQIIRKLAEFDLAAYGLPPMR